MKTKCKCQFTKFKLNTTSGHALHCPVEKHTKLTAQKVALNAKPNNLEPRHKEIWIKV